MSKSALIRTLSQLKDGEYVSFSTSDSQAKIVVRATKTTPHGTYTASQDVGAAGVIDSATADAVMMLVVSQCVRGARRAAEIAKLERLEAEDAGRAEK